MLGLHVRETHVYNEVLSIPMSAGSNFLLLKKLRPERLKDMSMLMAVKMKFLTNFFFLLI